jgi:hypothetical protein
VGGKTSAGGGTIREGKLEGALRHRETSSLL